MGESDLEDMLGPALAAALAGKGYTTLTAVQEAVLAPELAGRDLRISSQTGSGKTVAIGFTLRDVLLTEGGGADGTDEAGAPRKRGARPRALVVAPTRELAKQVSIELSWLFAPMGVTVSAVTGGGNYRDEHRALAAGPGVVVGTPGRLLDHLDRGVIDGTNLGAVVFDEADRMLDLGFRDDLEKILAFAPEEHRTHLVSATFPREVLALADRVQSDPVRIEGTPLGSANTDIEHLVHLVRSEDRLAAIVNLLLATHDAQTLVFARTRADVAELTKLLSDAGFSVDALSGEMEQRERNRALAAFKRGDLDALIATDVAARGIDVADVVRVIHAEPPTDADAYTHRSGRTGRAGRKGTSSVLVTPPALNRTSYLLKRAGVRWAFAPVPSAAEIRAARDERLFGELTREPKKVEPWEEESDGDDASDTGGAGPEPDDRAWALAKRIAEAGETTRALAHLIARARSGGPEPRDLARLTPPSPKKDRERAPARDEGRPGERREWSDARRLEGDGGRERAPAPAPRRHEERAEREPRRHEERPRGNVATEAVRDESVHGGYIPFRVTWGQVHGADARRLVAMLCRRGGIRGSDIGAIRVSRTYSVVEVAAPVARSFESATAEPDPRDPRVRIRRWSEEPLPREATFAPREAPHVPRERPSRAKVTPEVPADRPSRAKVTPEVPADRPSRAKVTPEVPAERPSRARPAHVPADRPSRAKPPAPTPADRPSRARRPSPPAKGGVPHGGPQRHGHGGPQRHGHSGPQRHGHGPPKRRRP